MALIKAEFDWGFLNGSFWLARFYLGSIWLALGSDALCAEALDATNSTTKGSTNVPAQTTSSPKELEERKRITVDTNVLTAGSVAATNATPKSFQWKSAWHDWDGLHFELIRKTWLGMEVREVTNLHHINLEESRMAGKIGMKFALDAAAFVTGNKFTDFDNGFELRRALIYAKGDCLLIVPVSYELEIGYVPKSFFIENSYLKFADLGVLGDFKLGQYRVPMGLENYGSSRDTLLMEMAAPEAALAPGVNAGWQLGRAVLNQRMTWALGMFSEGVGHDVGDATKNFGRVLSRLTGLPIYERDEDNLDSQRLLHIGLSGTLLYAGDAEVRYRSRPESHLAPYVVDTGNINADTAYIFGAEAAWVQGPLSVQGEVFRSWVNQNHGELLNFGGSYGAASWFITGESRPYNQREGTFDRVIPKQNFNWGKGGWGAWEIVGRYSYLDLNSGAIEGGRMAMATAELNWYLHPHVKWRFNYGFGHVTGRDPQGNLNLFQTRIEVDF